MLNEISWSEYVTVVVVLSAIYYTIILYRFYRHDILQLLSGEKVSDEKVNFASSKINKVNLEQSFEKLNSFPLAQSLADEIKAFLEEAGRNKISQEDIIPTFRLLLSKYSKIKGSSFQDFIEKLIQTETESNCSIHLSEEEVRGLW